MSALYDVATALLFCGAAAFAIDSIAQDGATYWDKAINALLYEPRP